MIYVERYTSPVAGAPPTAKDRSSAATGMGRFRIHAGASYTDARITERSLDDMGRNFWDQEVQGIRNAAREEARSEVVGHALTALNAAADRVDEARERAEEALSADAVTLGVEIARQILKVQIHAGDYALEAIVRSTLAASEIRRGRCIVHLHPVDAAQLDGVVFRGETEIVADGDVKRGSVQLETPRGLLVRDPDSALEEIREQLLEDLV